MKRTYIGRAIATEMELSDTRQAQIAEACNLSQASISAIISSPVRVAPESLRAITHCWPTPEANVRVLIAHLRDEIHRAGHDPENALDIKMRNGRPEKTAAARDLDVLRDHISDADVAALIHDLAVLIKRADKHDRAHAAARASYADPDKGAGASLAAE